MTPSRRRFLQASLASAPLLAFLEGSGAALAEEKKKLAWPNHPFLQGNYGPVQEEVTADSLKVIGQLPAELDGMYVRNGPNPQFPPLGGYHWFEGDGMLHGVRIRDGKASYRNRFVRTAAWRAENKAGKALYPSFTDPPSKKLSAGLLPPGNKANTALVWHDGRLLALWEAGEPHAIAVPSLDTTGPYKYDGKLKHPFTAHPKVDPATGEMIFFGYNVMMKPFLQYSVVDAKGLITRTTPIEIPRAVMMHDFAVSQKHTLFMDLPETFSLERAMKGQPPFKFEPELGARIGVLPRHGEGKDVKWFSITPCFVFHTLNAYDDGDEVVLLACRMNEFPKGIDFVATPHPMDTGLAVGAASYLYRWRLNLKTGAVKEGPLDDVSSEFPRLPDGLMGKSSRFGYCARAGGELFDGLLKYDLLKGTREEHVLAKGRSCGEAVFVPRPGAKEEDDGWLVTFVHDAASGKGELLVLNARQLQAPPVARVLIPARVPFGFHGLWLEGRVLS